MGLSFEHGGGVAGSANHRGPILLASHAGMFVRMYRLTKDSYIFEYGTCGCHRKRCICGF